MIVPVNTVYSQDAHPFNVVPLTKSIYRLTVDMGGYAVNVLASVGDDGILLVDTGEKVSAADLKAAIDTLGGNQKETPSIIINTHAHVDHTGGNDIFGRKPVVVAHEILRSRLRSGSYLFDEFSDATLPDVVFKDSLTIFFNGDEIKLKLFPGSHDDNDIVVWFTKDKIAYIGDITNGTNFPSVEEITGNVLNFPEISMKVYEYLPEGVTVVSGHGLDTNRNQLKDFSQNIAKTIAIIRRAVDDHKDEAAMVKEDILRDWESYENSYVSRDEWINMVYTALTDTLPKKAIYEPIYYALQNGGPDSAVNVYYELKNNHFDEYRFAESDLMFMADKLYKKERYDDAIAIFELDLQEYPEGMYAYYNYYLLGNIYRKVGNQERALESYKASYKLKETETVANILKELDGK